MLNHLNPFRFFHRMEGMNLVEGNKTAGWTFVVDSRALLALMYIKVTPEVQARITADAKARIERAKLLPKIMLKSAGIVFWKDTLVPRVFQGDPMLGGSIGADPETFGRLERPDALMWLLDETEYTAHNTDTAKMALSLAVLATTWSEYASSYLYSAWKEGKILSDGRLRDQSAGGMRPIDDPQYLMTLAEYDADQDTLEGGDESGSYATATHYAPGASTCSERPAWATHVLWCPK